MKFSWKLEKDLCKRFTHCAECNYLMSSYYFQDTTEENNCPNNNTLSAINASNTVTKKKSLQVINNFKNKKGKHNKYKKLVNLRVSQLLQRESKVNIQNTSNAAECLSFNSQNSFNDSPSTSNSLDSSKSFSPRGKNNLKRRREEDSLYPIISLDSPSTKSAIRYPVICEIDLTASPGNNNNNFYKNIPRPNSHPIAISTPFSYAHVAGLRSSPNIGAVSPINKKLRLSIDDADSLRQSNNNDTSKGTFIYEPPEFITVDRYDPGQSTRDETTQNTVIFIDNEETVLPAGNPPNDTLILDASDIEFVSKNNMSSGELNSEKFFPVRSIDLTDNLKENMPALPVSARQPIIYDLTLDNSHDSNLTSSLVKKREQILSALAHTVNDSSKKYTKTKSATRTGSNICFPANDKNKERTGLRMVVIDGSNVAMG